MVVDRESYTILNLYSILIETEVASYCSCCNTTSYETSSCSRRPVWMYDYVGSPRQRDMSRRDVETEVGRTVQRVVHGAASARSCTTHTRYCTANVTVSSPLTPFIDLTSLQLNVCPPTHNNRQSALCRLCFEPVSQMYVRSASRLSVSLSPSLAIKY